LAPLLEELASAYEGRVKFVLVNTDLNRMSQSQYSVDGTPTLIFFKKGRLVDRAVGALPRADLTRRLDSLIAAA